MPTPSVPFVYPEDETDPSPYSLAEDNKESLRKITRFIAERIIARHHGKLPPARTIAARLIVMQALINPEELQLKYVRKDGVLSAIARELGCSRAWLSKVGIEFSDSIGMRGSWQRWVARKVYAERAAGVHAGKWLVSGRCERRRLQQTKLKNVTWSSHTSCQLSLQQNLPTGKICRT